MKLLLSDGIKVTVEKYEYTNTLVDGDTVDAISLEISNHTIEEVKAIFSNGAENLGVMKLYTNEDILKETFTGYQMRRFIGFGSEEDLVTVLLAKRTDTTARVSSLEKDVKELNKHIKELEDTIVANAQAVAAIGSAVEAANGSISSQANSIRTVMDSVQNISSEVEESRNEHKETMYDFAEIKENTAAVMRKVNDLVTTMNDVVGKVESLTASMVMVVNTSDAADISVQGMKDSIDYLNENLEFTKKLTTETDANVKIANEETNRFKELMEGKHKEVSKDVAEVKESVSATTASVCELDGKVSGLEEKTKKFENTMETNASDLVETKTALEASLETLASDAKTLKENAESAAETTKAIEERVTALEPITDITALPLSEAIDYRVKESADKLAEFLASHPIISKCHGGVENFYTITAEKQSLLQGMIMIAKTAVENNLKYQASWNATGEQCTYDWTLEELCQLALEIEAAVRPLVSHQQTIERDLRDATSMEVLQAVVIDYEGIEPNALPIPIEVEDPEEYVEE